MLIRKACDMKEKLDNKYLFRRKIFSYEEHTDHNFFLKKADLTSFFKRIVYPVSKSYADFL